jgi:flagellar biosynthesis protein FlhF
MKVRRYVAVNSREALAKARAEIGPDAVVLSGRQTGGGFELLALAKSDVAVLVNAGREQKVQEPAAPVFPTRAQPAAQKHSPGPRAAAPAARATAPKPWIPPRSSSGAIAAAAPAPAAALAVAPAPAVAPRAAEPVLVNEIRALRSMVEEQGAHLAWMHDGKSRPLRSAMLRELLAAGFGAALSRRIAKAVPDDLAVEPARQWLARTLARNLHCAGGGPDPVADPAVDPVASGGVFALVGPTGAGKTTTTAKLAAGCVVRYGAGSLGLISADHYRIGAQDQLRIYGRILGVPVHAVHDADSLRAALEALAGKRLVLIDSIGVGQRDVRVAEQTALFEEQGIDRILLLSAASQAETLEEVVQAYGAQRLRGAILTKADEAVLLGGALDCAIRHRLRISHVTNGQRVPEDIHPANAAWLIHRALSAVRAPVFRMQEEELDLLAFVPQRALPRTAPQSVAHAGH